MSIYYFVKWKKRVVLARKHAVSLFLLTTAFIYGLIFVVTHTSRALSHPRIMGPASLLDLVITVPLFYYLLVVRSGYSSWPSLFVVSFAGVRAAAFLLPTAEQTYLPALRWLGVPFELFLIAAIVRRFRQVARSDNDVLTRIRGATRAVPPHKGLAGIVAAELAVFYYALFSWRARPCAEAGYQTFTCTEASGYGLFSILVILALIFEGLPMHFVLLRWSHVAAWICTAIDLHGLMWLIAIRRSVRLRPILIGEEFIFLRAGFMWQIDIPRENIAALRRVSGSPPNRKTPGYLRMVIINEPQYIIELTEPAVAHGLYGRSRRVTRIGIAVDDPRTFAAALDTAN